MRPLVGLASIALLFASAALAQVRETVNVDFVEVPVNVVDRPSIVTTVSPVCFNSESQSIGGSERLI